MDFNRDSLELFSNFKDLEQQVGLDTIARYVANVGSVIRQKVTVFDGFGSSSDLANSFLCA